MSDYTSLRCPMPECDADLYLTWDLTRPLFQMDIADGAAIDPGEAYTGGWGVRCLEGHVVLIPTLSSLCCEQGECVCDVDSDDELRTFRASDVARLESLLASLGAREAGE